MTVEWTSGPERPKALASNAHTYRLSVFKELGLCGRLERRVGLDAEQRSAKTAILARFEAPCQDGAFDKDKELARSLPL